MRPLLGPPGAQISSEGGLNYLGNENIVHASNILATLIIQVLLMGTIELYRYEAGETYPGASRCGISIAVF